MIRRRRLVLLVVWLGITWLSSTMGVSLAALSGTTSNVGNSFQAAASFCTNPGPQTASASRDAWVDELVPLLNHGTETSLYVQSALAQNRRTIIAFTLPSIPARCTITLATLRLFATSAQGNRSVGAWQATANWVETTVTWNTQPGVTGGAATTTVLTGWNQWTVTGQVQSMYSGSNFGFVVKDTVEGSVLPATQVFSSREAASNKPQLVITFG